MLVVAAQLVLHHLDRQHPNPQASRAVDMVGNIGQRIFHGGFLAAIALKHNARLFA